MAKETKKATTEKKVEVKETKKATEQKTKSALGFAIDAFKAEKKAEKEEKAKAKAAKKAAKKPKGKRHLVLICDRDYEIVPRNKE